MVWAGHFLHLAWLLSDVALLMRDNLFDLPCTDFRWFYSPPTEL
jgi:hypothetical protein